MTNHRILFQKIIDDLENMSVDESRVLLKEVNCHIVVDNDSLVSLYTTRELMRLCVVWESGDYTDEAFIDQLIEWGVNGRVLATWKQALNITETEEGQ